MTGQFACSSASTEPAKVNENISTTVMLMMIFFITFLLLNLKNIL
jgi:hypothetical protein